MNKVYHLKKTFTINDFWDYPDQSLVLVSLPIWIELLKYVGSIRRLNPNYNPGSKIEYIPFYTRNGEIRIELDSIHVLIDNFNKDLKALLDE